MNNDKKIKDISRRKFMGQASCAGIGYMTLMNTFFNLKAINAAAVSNSAIASVPGDYKALVCVLLGGGNDSYNMLIPNSTSAYNAYAATRIGLSIPQADLLPLNGQNYGVHPELSGFQSLYNQNKLAFVTNVGTLLDYVTPTQYATGAYPEPKGLYSHSDQVQQWQTAVYDKREYVGWGGRIADLLNDTYNNSSLSMNFSLSGSNLFETGGYSVEYTLDPYYGPVGIDSYNPNVSWLFETLRKRSIDTLIEHQYQDMFKNTYANVLRDGRDSWLELETALANAAGISANVTFSDSSLSRSFEWIAKCIQIQNALGIQRQIFFVELNGWDNHDDLFNYHTPQLSVLNNALFEFNAALEDIGFQDDVVTFGISEFARTLTPNGNAGSDHAWGGNTFVMGSPTTLNGGIYGTYPTVSLTGNSSIIGDPRGIVIPTTPTDLYIAELAKWFGVPNSDLTGTQGANLIPGLSNFWSPSGNNLPIGFLNV